VGPTFQWGRKLKRKEKRGKEVGACGLVYWADLGCFVPGWPSWLLPFFLILLFFIFCPLFSLEFENKNYLDLDISKFVNF
jgi:hypothetical protein